MPVGRQLVLTSLAQDLVEPVRAALLQVRGAILRTPGFDPATAERRFEVCASDYVTTVLLAQVVQQVAPLATATRPGSRKQHRSTGVQGQACCFNGASRRGPHPCPWDFKTRHRRLDIVLSRELQTQPI